MLPGRLYACGTEVYVFNGHLLTTDSGRVWYGRLPDGVLWDVTRLFERARRGDSVLYRRLNGWLDVGVVQERLLTRAGDPAALMRSWRGSDVLVLLAPGQGPHQEREDADGQHVDERGRLVPGHA